MAFVEEIMAGKRKVRCVNGYESGLKKQVGQSLKGEALRPEYLPCVFLFFHSKA
jgi:hypothetical protein